MRTMNSREYSCKVLFVALTVSLVSPIMGSSAAAALPAFCNGDGVPQKYAQQVVLASKSESVAPGNYVYTRLLNGLNRPVGLGRRYLQRYVDGTWENVLPPDRADGPVPIYSPPIRRLLAADSASECRPLRITPEQPRGRYRLVNEVYLNLRPGAKPRVLTAQLRVTRHRLPGIGNHLFDDL